MSYATIMVNLTLGATNEARLTVARDLADRFKSRVIGIAAADLSPPMYFTSGPAAQDLIDRGNASIAAGLAALEHQFRAAMEALSGTAEWRCARQLPARYVMHEARAADIVVAGQAANSVAMDSFAQAGLGDLVMQLGRPLIIVPDTVRWLDLRSCLIAWKDTAEARRAVSDALPLLRHAKEVTIVEIVESGTDTPAALAQIRDVAAFLRCHGISPAELVIPRNGNVGDQLRQIASDTGAGVVVAGAYGHSRLREWVFGGVTRQLVESFDRCSLLSR